MTEFIQTIVLGLLIGGVYALLAAGLTLIFGVMGVINIAHGSFLILAGFLTYAIWSGLGLDPLAAIVLTTPAMFAFGWCLYNVTIGEVFLPKAQLYGCGVALLVLSGLWLTLTRTWLGRAIRASAINPQGAALVGVNVAGVSAMTFAVGVASAGAGGSIVSVLFPFLPGSHYAWIARLLGIIVLGGMGSLGGAVSGALLLGMAEALTSTYVAPRWATAVPYLVIFLVLLVRPQGLGGARLREDVAV
jgi:branched-chain amino acid transport system permease protein